MSRGHTLNGGDKALDTARPNEITQYLTAADVDHAYVSYGGAWLQQYQITEVYGSHTRPLDGVGICFLLNKMLHCRSRFTSLSCLINIRLE